MIIKRICLKNFGCVEDFNYSFPSSVTILSGDNGNGKSTIIKAIMLALFDSYTGVLSDYVQWGKKEFKIEIDFSHRGKEYKSVTIYGKDTNRTLEVDGNVYTGQEALHVLKEELHPSLLKASCLVAEQEIDIVTAKPAERRDYLKSIYDLDFKTQIEGFNSEIESLKNESAILSGQILSLSEKTYPEPSEPEAPFSKKEYDEFLKNEIVMQKEIEELKAKVAVMEAAEQTVESSKEFLESFKRELKTEEELLEKSERNLEEIPAETRKLRGELNLQISDLESSLEDARNQLASLLDTIPSQIDSLKGQLKRLPIFDEDEYLNLRSSVKSLTEEVNKLSNLSDVCPTCGQKLTEDAIKKQESLKEQSKKKLDEETDLLSILEEKRIQLKEMEESNNQLKEKISQLENTLVKEEASLDGEITSVSTELSLKKEKLGGLERETELKLKAGQLEVEGHKDKIKTINSRIEEETKRLEDAKKKIDYSFTARLSHLEDDLRTVKSNVALYTEYESQIKVYKDSLRLIEKQKKEDSDSLEKLRVQSGSIATQIDDLALAVKILKTDFPVYVISKITLDIQKRMNTFLQKTYGGRYTVSVEDKKNALHIVFGPSKQDVSLASGYEKSLFNLAFKIAISYEIGNKLLILDEADSAASGKNSIIFYKTLGEALDYFKQIILVSHKEDTRSLLETEFSAQTLTFVRGRV